MPIIKYKNNNDTQLAVWKVVEDVEYFKSKLTLSTQEQLEVEPLLARKKLEWYASRYLLHILSKKEERIPIVKDVHGKPSFADNVSHVSISHTRNYVAAIVGPKSVGIDIQVYVSKIKRIQHKFVSEEEQKHHDIEDTHRLHLIWGAKESMYKAYGKRKLDFRKNMIILPIDDTKQKHTSRIQVKDSIYTYNLYFEEENDYILVYVEDI